MYASILIQGAFDCKFIGDLSVIADWKLRRVTVMKGQAILATSELAFKDYTMRKGDGIHPYGNILHTFNNAVYFITQDGSLNKVDLEKMTVQFFSLNDLVELHSSHDLLVAITRDNKILLINESGEVMSLQHFKRNGQLAKVRITEEGIVVVGWDATNKSLNLILYDHKLTFLDDIEIKNSKEI